jgi:hypothetical protein
LVTASDLDNIEFKIIKEVWNEYELKDGTKIKGRMFLTRIIEDKNSPKPQLKPGEQVIDLRFSFAKHFETFAPKDQLGAPTIPLPQIDQINQDDLQEVDPITHSEPWNVYEIIKNGTVVKAKLVVSEFFKIKNKFDNLGQPYYLMKNGPVFDVKPNTSTQKFA